MKCPMMISLAAFGVFFVGNTDGAFVATGAEIKNAARSAPWTAHQSPSSQSFKTSDRTTARDMSPLDEASSVFGAASNMWLSTIDADIANISDNEFAPIFAGGILVMFGGLISAIIVGGILESRNNYAEVVADSYVQGAEDAEFWKGLSDEEKKKLEEMLQKVKNSKSGGGSGSKKEKISPVVMEEGKGTEAVVSEKKTEDIDMFSDYADDA